MRISDWSSDVCSSDLYKTSLTIATTTIENNERVIKNLLDEIDLLKVTLSRINTDHDNEIDEKNIEISRLNDMINGFEAESTQRLVNLITEMKDDRSEEHTSELQSLMRISYAVFCLKKQN